MTKAELIAQIAEQTGVDKITTSAVVESLMDVIKSSLTKKDENVYLRGFGSFIVKERAAKTGRNISKNVTIEIPAHYIPAFKPAKEFMHEMAEKTNK